MVLEMMAADPEPSEYSIANGLWVLACPLLKDLCTPHNYQFIYKLLDRMFQT